MTTDRHPLDRYRASLVARGHRPRGIRRYLDQVSAFLTWLDDRPITMETITQYQEHMAERCSAGTVGNALTAIRSYCHFLMQQGDLDDDPTRAIRWPRRRRPLPRPLARSELRRLCETLKVIPEGLPPRDRRVWERNRRLICLMLYAGLRISEAAALRWRDVDIDAGMLTVVEGKGGKDRVVPIHPRLRDLLEAAKGKPAHAVAGGPDGKPLSYKSAAHIFERWLPRLGFQFSSHRLRHTFATELIRAGADLRSVQELLGHDSPETTAIYVKVAPEQLRAAVEMLPDSF